MQQRHQPSTGRTRAHRAVPGVPGTERSSAAAAWQVWADLTHERSMPWRVAAFGALAVAAVTGGQLADGATRQAHADERSVSTAAETVHARPSTGPASPESPAQNLTPTASTPVMAAGSLPVVLDPTATVDPVPTASSPRLFSGLGDNGFQIDQLPKIPALPVKTDGNTPAVARAPESLPGGTTGPVARTVPTAEHSTAPSSAVLRASQPALNNPAAPLLVAAGNSATPNGLRSGPAEEQAVSGFARPLRVAVIETQSWPVHPDVPLTTVFRRGDDGRFELLHDRRANQPAAYGPTLREVAALSPDAQRVQLHGSRVAGVIQDTAASLGADAQIAAYQVDGGVGLRDEYFPDGTTFEPGEDVSRSIRIYNNIAERLTPDEQARFTQGIIDPPYLRELAAWDARVRDYENARDGVYSTNIAEAIEQASRKGNNDAINISHSRDVQDVRARQRILRAVQAAEKRGVTVVAPTSNDGLDEPDGLAPYPGHVASVQVGSVWIDEDGQPVHTPTSEPFRFPQRLGRVDVVGLGGSDEPSTDPDGPCRTGLDVCVVTAEPGEKRGEYGVSFASAEAAALLAALRARHPELTERQVRRLLAERAVPVGVPALTGHGFVDERVVR